MLPEAVILVKQAAGRPLIRSASDSGVLVLADSGRLATKRYGKTFIKSLPSKERCRC